MTESITHGLRQCQAGHNVASLAAGDDSMLCQCSSLGSPWHGKDGKVMSMAILMCSVRDVSTPICGEACMTGVTDGVLHGAAY